MKERALSLVGKYILAPGSLSLLMLHTVLYLVTADNSV